MEAQGDEQLGLQKVIVILTGLATALLGLFFILGGAGALLVMQAPIAKQAAAPHGMPNMNFALWMMVVMGGLLAWYGIGLMRLRRWAGILALLGSVVGLFNQRPGKGFAAARRNR